MCRIGLLSLITFLVGAFSLYAQDDYVDVLAFAYDQPSEEIVPHLRSLNGDELWRYSKALQRLTQRLLLDNSSDEWQREEQINLCITRMGLLMEEIKALKERDSQYTFGKVVEKYRQKLLKGHKKASFCPHNRTLPNAYRGDEFRWAVSPLGPPQSLWLTEKALSLYFNDGNFNIMTESGMLLGVNMEY